MPGRALVGRQVSLRSLRRGDAPASSRMLKDRRAIRFLPPRVRRESGRQFVERVLNEQRRAGGSSFAIVENEFGEVVGQVRLFGLSRTERFAEVGYWLGRRWWGRGFATEAVRLICGHGFRTLHLHRIDARVVDGNYGSIRVLQKAGFRKEGRSRQAALTPRGWKDVLVFGLLRKGLRAG